MSQNDILRTGRFYHLGRHLASVCAFFLVCTVLCTQTDSLGIQYSGYGSQVDERRTDDYITIRFVGSQSCIQLSSQSYTFLQIQVHLPVTCNNFLSHFFSF